MQSPNHRPGKLDKLSQHAVETNHKSGKSDMLSQHAQCRQAIPNMHCTNMHCIKEAAKAQTADKLTQCNIAVEPERDLHKKSKQSKQLQHLRRLG